jgi:hypothetical protein
VIDVNTSGIPEEDAHSPSWPNKPIIIIISSPSYYYFDLASLLLAASLLSLFLSLPVVRGSITGETRVPTALLSFFSGPSDGKLAAQAVSTDPRVMVSPEATMKPRHVPAVVIVKCDLL